MARMASISVLGLYEYDNTIFDGLKLPEGVDKETLITNLVTELSGFEILYPNPDFMKRLIPVWSAKEFPVWHKLYETTLLKYDPLSNYDRTEEWEDVGDNSATNNGTTKNIGSSTGSSSGSSSGSGSNKNSVAGFNSSELVENEKAENSGQSSSSSSNNSSSNSDTTISGTSTEKLKSTHRGRVSGNIGVTTSQQMLDEERRVALFNLYDRIIESFKMRFCVLVY